MSACLYFALILVNRSLPFIPGPHMLCACNICNANVVVPTVRLIVCYNWANTKLWAYLIVPEENVGKFLCGCKINGESWFTSKGIKILTTMAYAWTPDYRSFFYILQAHAKLLTSKQNPKAKSLLPTWKEDILADGKRRYTNLLNLLTLLYREVSKA